MKFSLLVDDFLKGLEYKVADCIKDIRIVQCHVAFPLEKTREKTLLIGRRGSTSKVWPRVSENYWGPSKSAWYISIVVDSKDHNPPQEQVGIGF